ncbi:cytochrome c oxidase assembly protein COX18, mitochondrial isoform X1 [Ischnura elegans]|uniref:cytochrome c oxidase assembly protein COX18, mitochondrial isoform X1 n=3 Tax=Ischnura elegans TaxID=197161 RepID=UPI001ED8A490|nr:cytochrome c oxidase assembly protein COX18, mitochondrial isoform X1 [Ischnura elegans]
MRCYLFRPTKYRYYLVSSKYKFLNHVCICSCYVPKRCIAHGNTNDFKSTAGIRIGSYRCVNLFGKPLLSNGNIFVRGNDPFSNGFSMRHSSFESVARAQSNLFTYLSESTPVHHAQKFFELIHDTSGLPWWASIIVTTVVVRSLVAFPLALHQNYILAKVQNLQHEMKTISQELGREVSFAVKKFGWSNEQAQLHYKYSLKKQWDKLVVRDNCHPFKASLPIWFQMPMWIFLSISLRNMAYMLPHRDSAAELIFLQLSQGGCLWFPNLIDVDHTLILPVTLGLLNLAIVELQTITRLKEPTKFQRNLTNLIRLLSIAMVPIASSVPTCMSLYWVSSSACGLIQNLLVLSPRIKNLVGIPKVIPLPSVKDSASESSSNDGNVKNQCLTVEQQEYLHYHPYRYIASEIKTRVNDLRTKLGAGT